MNKNHFGQPGNFSLLAGLSLALLLGFLALVVDVGFLYLARQQQETTAEAAALAAVHSLDKTPAGLTAARAVADQLVDANDPNNEYNFDPATEVTFGAWDDDARTFTATSDPVRVDAVRVTVSRTNAKGNPLTPAFAALFAMLSGGDPDDFNANVSRSATAFLPYYPTSEARTISLAASECAVLTTGDQPACDREIILGGDGSLACNIPGRSGCFIDTSHRHLPVTMGDNNTLQLSFFNIFLQGFFLTACLSSGVSCGSVARITNGEQIATSSSGTLFDALALSDLPAYIALVDPGVVRVAVGVFGVSDCANPGAGTISGRLVDGIIALDVHDFGVVNGERYIRAQVKCDVDLVAPISVGVSSGSGDYGAYTPGDAVLVQ